MSCGGCGRNNTPKVKIQVPTTAPQIVSDGYIEFPGGSAPILEGYTTHPDDESVLIPDGKHCILRITGMMLQKDGTYKPFHACRCPACPHRSKEVTFEVCDACEHRSDSL